MTPFEPLLEKAERFIRSAEMLQQEGDLDSATSRLYYAMFFIAEVLLQKKGMTFSSHKAVISAFGLYFAKTGEIDHRFHQYLITAFSQRQLADYAASSGLQTGDVQSLIDSAKDFLKAARQWLQNQESFLQ